MNSTYCYYYWYLNYLKKIKTLLFYPNVTSYNLSKVVSELLSHTDLPPISTR